MIPEGAAQPEALLGTIRLVGWLASQSELAGRNCHLVVDSGTGATAAGAPLFMLQSKAIMAALTGCLFHAKSLLGEYAIRSQFNCGRRPVQPVRWRCRQR